MSIKQAIKRALLSDGFDPFDLTQMQPPKSFRSERFKVDLDAKYDPFEGFRDSMILLGNDLKRGIELYGDEKQAK